MYDLTLTADRQRLAARILNDIDTHCQSYSDSRRSHLGASELGDVCARRLYYKFRWFRDVQHSGRMNRLFNRGQLEESRFVEWLRAIGFDIWSTDNDGKQFHIARRNLHLGGSIDGVANLSSYGMDTKFLLEFKTKGTGAEFNKLKEKGVAFVMPKHFIQTSIYGKSFGLEYALYFCINKNDDDLYVEVVKLDWQLAETYLKRGEDIINAIVPPIRVSDNPAYIECKICDYHSICHQGIAPERNCRTCKFSKPEMNGSWVCGQHESLTIPPDVLPTGCTLYAAIQ